MLISEIKPEYIREIFQKDGKWFFWNETACDYHGPFDTKEIAADRLKEYCNYLDGCGYN